MTATAPAGLWSPIHRTLLPHGIGPDGVRELYVRGGGEILSRSSLAVPAGTTADFGSYFGGFPAGVWAAHTTVERVRTRARVTGTAEVSLCRTDGRGGREVIAFERATDGDVVFDTLLAGASGWWWLEVAADPGTDAVVDGIVWAAEGTGPEPGRIAVSITTFDREADCIRLIERLDSDPVVAGLIGRITVADQGSRRLAAAEGFAEVAERVGDRLVVIEQANLGGAGGYSRGMLEAEAGDWEHALLIDDDVDLEPESVLRMAAFAAHARGRRIVGAHMLDLLHPTSVHSWGEVIDRGRFWWGPEDAGLAPVDAAAHRPSTTPAMGRVLDVDFNGWWMCLIPVSVIREIGVALPLFIKWDDAEYGLRAAAIGVPTVSLPGAALWHMPWTGKDNGLDWQVYYQVRNRIVAALLHDGSAVGVVKALFAADVNHLLSLQYGSVEARLLALRDAMSGPEHLPATISRRRADVVQILRRHGQMLHPAAQPTRPADKSSPGFRALPRVLLHQLSPSHHGRTITPTVVPTVDGRWWRLGTLDAASLYAASGDGFFPLRRDRRRFIRYSLLSAVAHARLLMTWHRLAREYRASAQDLASPATWRSIFGE